MKKSKVRCWRVENNRIKNKVDILYVTYPEGNSGHNLISCLNCGHIYSVDLSAQVYIGPQLDEKLNKLKCLKCSLFLKENFFSYPDKYLVNGSIIEFQKSTLIPDDKDSLVVEFDEIYS